MFKFEPARLIGSLVVLANAVIILIVSFGVELDDSQQAAILGLFVVISGILGIETTRAKVTPTSKVPAIQDAAFEQGKLAQKAKKVAPKKVAVKAATKKKK